MKKILTLQENGWILSFFEHFVTCIQNIKVTVSPHLPSATLGFVALHFFREKLRT